MITENLINDENLLKQRNSIIMDDEQEIAIITIIL